VRLTLEGGVLRDLHRRLHIDLPGVEPSDDTRRSLVLDAAHTVFPEAAVQGLPDTARAELTAGLTGPLRHAIAAADPSDSALPGLRDQLVEHLTGDPGGSARSPSPTASTSPGSSAATSPRSSPSDACSGTAPTAPTTTPTPPSCAHCSNSATPGSTNPRAARTSTRR